MTKHGQECLCKHCVRKRTFARVDAHQKSQARKERSEKSRFESGHAHQIGNSTRRNQRARHLRKSSPSPELLHWRLSVLTRDGFKCIWCGSTSELEADHIKPRHLYPGLKYDIDNGRTLCHGCHKKTPTYGSKVRKLVAIHEEPLDGLAV